MPETDCKTFQIKNIPTDDWANFKIRHIKAGTSSLNETMLKLIRAYGAGTIKTDVFIDG